MSLLRYILVSVPLVVLLGVVSGQISGSGAGNRWFEALEKPTFMPPGWLFGVAWTMLYVLLGLVLAILLHARGARWRSTALSVFVAQLAVNYLWSPTFFALHQVGWALVMIALMIGLTFLVAGLLWRMRRRGAALLLLPYFAWLCFAAVLTVSIWTLNPNASQLAPRPISTDIPL